MPITTLAAVKSAFDIDGDAQDARISALISSVQALVERRFGLTIDSGSGSDDYNGSGTDVLLLRRVPLVAVTTVHSSTDLPRVYDATTLLTANEDYIVDLDNAILYRTDGLAFPRGAKTVRVANSFGYASIPADLERAAMETINVKLQKAIDKLYHLTSESRGEGSIAGIRWEDVPPDARDVFESYDTGRRVLG